MRKLKLSHEQKIVRLAEIAAASPRPAFLLGCIALASAPQDATSRVTINTVRNKLRDIIIKAMLTRSVAAAVIMEYDLLIQRDVNTLILSDEQVQTLQDDLSTMISRLDLLSEQEEEVGRSSTRAKTGQIENAWTEKMRE